MDAGSSPHPSGASKINVTPDLSRVPPLHLLQPPSTPLHPFPSISTLFPSWTYFSPLITAAAAGTGKEGRQGIEGKGVAARRWRCPFDSNQIDHFKSVRPLLRSSSTSLSAKSDGHGDHLALLLPLPPSLVP